MDMEEKLQLIQNVVLILGTPLLALIGWLVRAGVNRMQEELKMLRSDFENFKRQADETYYRREVIDEKFRHIELGIGTLNDNQRSMMLSLDKMAARSKRM